eukprot:CAMPEP_0170123642 /NCGR_PEP_ID=MMETSP0020_2-20130122/17621_1 /TAXON_ID=98059 /ORGANISM="Dinobryon sp., Strain UTEXLB2267" /LENGTH=135 /DNA_ID=CAMNT_0010355259 /DNA_START=1 /DNA_END=404 /DNA_ORIENTATION=-
MTEEGSLFLCGKGEYGRLGLGDEKSQLEPCRVEIPVSVDGVQADESVRLVSAGGSHTLFATSNHRIFSVGRLDCGRCGLESMCLATDRVCTPQDITERFITSNYPQERFDMKVLQVCAGGSHSVVLVEFSEKEAA